MDKSYSFSPSELRTLLDRKRKRYTVKSFTRNGQWITHLVIQDRCTGGTAIGKLVEKSSEEFRHRPRLHHRNLSPLTDMITIDDDFAIFVTDIQEKCLRDTVHEAAFVGDSSCLALKKSYIEDVLCALSYLHRNDLCLLNLGDANVLICEKPPRNKAIITDFGSLSEKDNSKGRFVVPWIHQPPELRMAEADAHQCDLVAAEMWTMGMMVLEVFTGHQLPWALVDYDPGRVSEMIDKVDYGILKIANSGSKISIHDLWEFKDFVRLFIDADPANRSSAKNAISAKYLQSSKNDLSMQKSPQKSPRGSSADHKTESTTSPDILKMPFDSNVNSKNFHRDIPDSFKASETPTGKSSSNVSFKKCVYPLKLNNHSDLNSSYNRSSSYADCGSNLDSKTENQDDGKHLKSKSLLNLCLVKEDLEDYNETRFSPKIQSKTSSSSQTECSGSFFKLSGLEKELNTDIPANVCQDKSTDETNNSFSINIPSDNYNYSPNATREVKNTTEMNNEIPNDSTENLPNKRFEKGNVLCDTNDFMVFADNLLQAEFDRLNNCRMILYQNNSSHKTKSKDKKDSKSTADSKKSVFRIPASKCQPAKQLTHRIPSVRRELYEQLKFDTQSIGTTLCNLPKSNITEFNFQSTTTNDGIKKTVEQSNLQEALNEKTEAVGKTLFTLPKSDNSVFEKSKSTDKNQKNSKSNVDSKKSVFRIPASKYRPAEKLMQSNLSIRKAINETLKSDTEIPFALPKSNNSAFHDFKSKATNTPDSMFATDNGIRKNAKKSNLEEAQQGTFNFRREVEDLNKKFHEIKTRNKDIFDLKLPSPPTLDTMNSAWRKWSDDVQTNINESRHCRFLYDGYKYPIHQEAQIPQSNTDTIQDEVIFKDNKKNASEDECQTCGNKLNEEAKDSKNVFRFTAKGCPLPHEYSIPTTTQRDDTTKSPSLLDHASAKKAHSGINTPEDECQTCGNKLNEEAKDSKNVFRFTAPLPHEYSIPTITHRDNTTKSLSLLGHTSGKKTRSGVNASEDECQTCGNGLNEERIDSKNVFRFPQEVCPLPNEYSIPTTTYRDDTTKSPCLFGHASGKKTRSGINDSKKIGCDTHNQVSVTPAIPNWNQAIQQGCPLPHEYSIPTTTHREDTTKSTSLLSPISGTKTRSGINYSKKIGYDTHNQVSVPPAINRNEKPDRMRNDKVKCSEDVAATSHCNPPKVIIVRGYTGRNPIRVETNQTTYVKKKRAPERYPKKSKKTEIKETYKTGSTKCLILPDSSDEKKPSKKRSTLKNCFCIGK